MADIPPGNYTLVAELWSGPSTVAEVGAMAVTVSGTDVEGVVITTAKPGTLRGTISTDVGVTRRPPDTVDIATRPRRPGAQRTFASVTGAVVRDRCPAGPLHHRRRGPEWLDGEVGDAGRLRCKRPRDRHRRRTERPCERRAHRPIDRRQRNGVGRRRVRRLCRRLLRRLRQLDGTPRSKHAR